MSNNKQSSVDWLIGEIIRHQMTFYGTSSMPLWIIEQAKAMHKVEIMDAHLEGQCDETEGYPLEIAKKFYNETFGDNNGK